ncbi:hypothetical protein BU14_0964s0003 [Porphyra umbilicalis]|uniref:Uncharacterized protein n=1 Tax=Porphyra umbilicalis TaxID=2786 RepID=A0A1X6NN00_PORUM|nr:hypothetical protein BU14_0964s0003 [Porphyra umbilicalis]|eukprot:OSX69994.1 hypothetical protein BU14_0964s0003 [Porphyra umbilicalis]
MCRSTHPRRPVDSATRRRRRAADAPLRHRRAGRQGNATRMTPRTVSG